MYIFTCRNRDSTVGRKETPDLVSLDDEVLSITESVMFKESPGYEVKF